MNSTNCVATIGQRRSTVKKINLAKLIRDQYDDEEINTMFEEQDAAIERQHELNKQVRREERLRKLKKRGYDADTQP
jgi:hypothetical protein